MNRPPPAECANCGATIPSRAHACPECGADERTGWRENSVYDHLDLPESALPDNDADATNRTQTSDRRVNGIPWYWWCIGVAILLFLGTGAVVLW